MKKLILILIIFSVSFSISKDPLRHPSEIKIGKITLDAFLKIHKDGLKATEALKNNDVIKESLNTYLQDKGLNIDYLKEADLSKANLKGLDFRFLNLKEATLLNSDLSHSDFEEANLKESDLSGADLSSSNLKAANLKEATVTHANFAKANLAYADIHQADGLILKQLLSCRSLYKTKLPEDILLLIKKENPELLKNVIK